MLSYEISSFWWHLHSFSTYLSNGRMEETIIFCTWKWDGMASWSVEMYLLAKFGWKFILLKWKINMHLLKGSVIDVTALANLNPKLQEERTCNCWKQGKRNNYTFAAVLFRCLKRMSCLTRGVSTMIHHQQHPYRQAWQ